MTRSPGCSMPSSFRQITIIGTGLIGGSIGLALKKNGYRGRIVGCDRKPILAKARKIGALHEAVTDPIAACRGSDLVVLATPVGGIIELIQQLGHQLPPETLVTDVGSTKAEIARRAEQAFGVDASKRFVGGHPMAGKENSGIEFADAELFRGAVWFMTPGTVQALRSGKPRELVRWVRRIGGRVEVADPDDHDELCAWI